MLSLRPLSRLQRDEKPTETLSSFVLILARLLKVLNNDILRFTKKSTAYISSEVGYLELGKGQIGAFLVPGELFPELWNGEFLPPWESATGKRAKYKVLKEMCTCIKSKAC